MSWVTIHLDDATIAALDAAAARIAATLPGISVSRDIIARSAIILWLAEHGSATPTPQSAPQTKPVFSAGTRLRAFRKSEGLSLKKLAEQCGASSAATISAIELGQRTPGFKLALALEKRTNGKVTVEDFGFVRETARRDGREVSQ